MILNVNHFWVIVVCLLLLIAPCQTTFSQEEKGDTPDKELVIELIMWGETTPRTFSVEVFIDEKTGETSHIIEGDILLPDFEELKQRAIRYREGRGVGIDPDEDSHLLWDGGLIPYTFNSNISVERGKRDIILDAIDHVNRYSNICLVPRNGQADYVEFISSTKNSSPIGKKGGKQTIKIQSENMGVVVHEILHTAGLEHEHTRSDRDSYVTINWDNIDPSKIHNFQIDPDRVDIGIYDYKSILHYSNKAFAVDPTDSSIITHDPNAIIGLRNGLSLQDRYSLQYLYPDGCGDGYLCYNTYNVGMHIGSTNSSYHFNGSVTINNGTTTGSNDYVNIAAKNFILMKKMTIGDGAIGDFYIVDYDCETNNNSRIGSSSRKADKYITTYELANYPNPANFTTTISYKIPENTTVNLLLYDISGRVVKQLVANEEKEVGFHDVNVDVSDLPSGVYLYTLQTTNYKETKKLIVN